MGGRQNRILIPSGVALISFGSTLWLVSGGTNSLFDLFGGENKELKFLVNAGVATLGIGYLCNALFVIWMFLWPATRFGDFQRLMQAFGIEETKSRELRWWEIFLHRQRWRRWEQLKQPLLDEFHLRLHSHAPQTLIGYCSRRNTGWYIAYTSGLASIIGWLAACVISMADKKIVTHSVTNFVGDSYVIASMVGVVIAIMLSALLIWCFDCETWRDAIMSIVIFGAITVMCWFSSDIVLTSSWFDSAGGKFSFAAFLVLIPGALFWQGEKWNQEF